jgi:hypothetical protein
MTQVNWTDLANQFRVFLQVVGLSKCSGIICLPQLGEEQGGVIQDVVVLQVNWVIGCRWFVVLLNDK